MLAYAILQMGVEEFFEARFFFARILIFRVIFDKPWKSAAEFVTNALNPFFFVQIVFIRAESMSCIH